MGQKEWWCSCWLEYLILQSLFCQKALLPLLSWWLTAFYLIQFLPLKLVTDTEHTIADVVTTDVTFVLSFDFQTCASARNITLINFRSYWNKKPIIVIISDQNIFSIFLRLSFFILSKQIYVKLIPVHFASKLGLLFLNSHVYHTLFF